MARIVLTPAQWAAVRRIYEYDTDQPSSAVASRRAAEKLKFTPPTPQAVQKKIKEQQWKRHGSLVGIVESAQIKADRLAVGANGSITAAPPVDESQSAMVEAARQESADKRAEVLARHRAEWKQIVVLRQEAINKRRAALPESLDALRLAKLAAETTKIQQDGERRAWGLDELPPLPDFAKLTDDELRRMASGRTH